MICVVADSGPLIALAHVRLLHVPAALYRNVLVTRTVLDECVAKNWRDDAQAILSAVDLGHIDVVPDPDIPEVLRDAALDAGEITAIALATERRATVLIDEDRGRRWALQLALPVIGLCGLLLLAKRESILPAVMPTLRAVRAGGYFLSEELMAYVANLAHE